MRVYTFNLSAADRNAMLASCPNSKTLAVRFDLMSTMNETQYHNYKDVVMEVVNANPTPGAVTYQDTNAATVQVTGNNQKIVQLHSTLQIHTAASTAKKSATISSYSLEINGNTYTPDSSGNVTFVNPNAAGTYTATVTTTDSRGYTATASIDIEILAWTEPTAIYSLARIDNFYTASILNVDGKISPLDGRNVLSITEKHRKIGTSSWSTPATVQDATDTTIQLDYSYEWEVLITVSDSFSSVEYIATVGRGIPIFFYDKLKHSVAVNGFPDEDEQFYVGGNIKATGDIETAGKVTCDKVSVREIPCTITKSSGNWTISEVNQIRSGNTVMMQIRFKGGGSSVAAGSNAFVGKLTSGCIPKWQSAYLQTYTSSSHILCQVDTEGNVTARIIGAALNLSTSSYARATGTFIIND